MIEVFHVDRDRLRVTVRGLELFTDQPVDDGGEDTAPKPMELFVASLAACIAFSRSGTSAATASTRRASA